MQISATVVKACMLYYRLKDTQQCCQIYREQRNFWWDNFDVVLLNITVNHILINYHTYLLIFLRKPIKLYFQTKNYKIYFISYKI